VNGGYSRDRERFPAVREKIGEDPARFLDYQDPEDLRLARARIRGIDRQEVIVEWLRVERELERGPREDVIEWIQQRNREIIEHGDRDDQLATAIPHDEIPSTESVAVWSDRDDGQRSSTYSRSTSRQRRRAATDGGERR
jgi:hypothetical protein